MGKRVFESDLSIDGIRNLKTQLLRYKDEELNKKCKLLVSNLINKGYEVAKNYIYDIVIPYIEEKRIFLTDYKSHLQEMVQTEKKSLEYVLIEESGPAHDKTFKMQVLVDGIVFGTGIGKSKKEAEQSAAKDAIKKAAR